ncbi:hypothetical protein L202_06661 [Cryptococcus amylolentus CBS 6039]|uniref:Uncharacterized protein n=1 Tax=Cryptococcus amylolentus CBS 6039 TaxID=1295533 RepID=A0A1E3HIG7_9TREE|nr:hypothetical protein L202_06661 [Cryptococcus amylolentus CBS 6039]ODN75536.1 hypothetical protein L202_06661 [Cryptococcus amylolentus CBS 6039]
MGETWGLVLSAGVLGLLVWEGKVLRTAWLALNLLDTLRALRTVRSNGRRIGIQTRKKVMREALACWIIYILGTSISPIISTLVAWIPLYAPIKAVVCLCFLFTRLASSAAILSSLSPFIRPYETPIDISIHLLESLFALVYHFGIELPFGQVWSCLGVIRQGVWSGGIQRAVSWAEIGWHNLQPSPKPAHPQDGAPPTPPHSPPPGIPPSTSNALPRKTPARSTNPVSKSKTRVRQPLEPIILSPPPLPQAPPAPPVRRPRRASPALPSFPDVPTHPINVVPSTPPPLQAVNAVASGSGTKSQGSGLLGVAVDEPVRRSPRRNKGKRRTDDEEYVPPLEEDGQSEAVRVTKRALKDNEEKERPRASATAPRAERLGKPSKRLHTSKPDHTAVNFTVSHPSPSTLSSAAPKGSSTSVNLSSTSVATNSRPLPASRSTATLFTTASRARREAVAADTAGAAGGGSASSRKGKGIARSATLNALPASSSKKTTTSRAAAVTSASVNSKTEAAEKKRQATGAGARARATGKRAKRDDAEDEGPEEGEEESTVGGKTREKVGEKRKAVSTRAQLGANETEDGSVARASKRTRLMGEKRS